MEAGFEETLAAAARTAATRVFERPMLAPWVAEVDLGDNRLEFRADRFRFALTAELWITAYHALRPFLGGSRRLEEVLAESDPAIPAAVKLFLLQVLQQNSLILDGDDEVLRRGAEPDAAPQGAGLFFSRFSQQPGRLQGAVANARMALVGDPAHTESLGELLSGFGAQATGLFGSLQDLERASPRPPGWDLITFFVPHSRPDELDAINAWALDRRQRWLRVVWGTASGILGPTFIPFQTACQRCLNSRAASHDRPGSPAQGTAPIVMPGPLTALLVGQTALEALRLVSGYVPPVTVGRYYHIDSRRPEAEGHDVLRIPRCPACGHGTLLRRIWDKPGQ